MGLRIQTNVASIITQRHLENNNSGVKESLERLSSGYRINRSVDDAAGLAVSESLRAKVRGLNQAKRNANDAISMVQIAEGSMNEISNIMVRLRELAVQSASDTIGSKERGFLNREYTSLVDEVDRIAKTTEFNNLRLFDENEKSNFVIQVGTNGTKPEENLDTIKIDLTGLKINTESLGLGKGAEVGPIDDSEGPARDEISQRLGVVDNALSRLASERASLGAVQSRLQSSINNLGISVENMETARSRIKDVDFASETANLAQRRILMQSNVAVLSQANAQPEMALQLLRQ